MSRGRKFSLMMLGRLVSSVMLHSIAKSGFLSAETALGATNSGPHLECNLTVDTRRGAEENSLNSHGSIYKALELG